MSRLTPAMRKQIISDYKNGIQNPDYRVIDRGDGTYQVRKRESKFKISQQQVEQQVEPQPEPEPKKEESNRLTNEELLRKLSVLLDVPQKQVDQTPEEYDQEQEAYEDDQEFIQRNIQTNFNPYRRPPLRLY